MAGAIATKERAVSLPTLVKRAARKLEKAQNAAQVLGARAEIRAGYSMAKIKARLQKASKAHKSLIADTHRAQADLLQLEAESNRRLADEYDAAQANGEASKGRPKSLPNGNTFTLAEAGITAKDIFLARQIRDVLAADSNVIETVLTAMLEKGDEPTRNALKKQLAPVIKRLRDETTAGKKSRRNDRERDLAKRQRALPKKRYGLICADPAWKFKPYSQESGMDRAADNHYPTMATDEICELNVDAIAADDCVLFLWATAPMLPDALTVMSAWGFVYKTHIIWRKAELKPCSSKDQAKRDMGGQSAGLVLGTGYWFRNAHELLLVGTRGAIPAPAIGTQFPSVIDSPPLRHSQKPDRFAELMETYFPNLPKIELNRRGPARPGWDAWGNEANEA